MMKVSCKQPRNLFMNGSPAILVFLLFICSIIFSLVIKISIFLS